MAKTDYTFKVIMLGEASTGKTSLSDRYITGVFNPDIHLTVGVDFYIKTVIVNGLNIKLQIWDLGGEVRFRFLLPTYCLGSSGAIFIYDITRPQTLDHIADWISIVREKNGDIPIYLVGNKVDLDSQRRISIQFGQKTQKMHKMFEFIEVSAKSGIKVEELFSDITSAMISRLKK